MECENVKLVFENTGRAWRRRLREERWARMSVRVIEGEADTSESDIGEPINNNNVVHKLEHEGNVEEMEKTRLRKTGIESGDVHDEDGWIVVDETRG
ncbi:hypothetical protein GLAREA_12494 [Glarea lozoyensis ATCC 20868]|uniref:Uncharacterized protein n=1 Tax=Glarea lozoyensis (strain ATCC 20868 / MF5171) TaxID=1116229 RepID=S3DZK5_GLAL2|nr:uncharacterized protein GLAREA_12494 [Glarea lozoyensis ATCC 20868]EPE31738.1 hypothetical protein GLAREA_12494 [Glarea lozoyensis ATCC 20868]